MPSSGTSRGGDDADGGGVCLVFVVMCGVAAMELSSNVEDDSDEGEDDEGVESMKSMDDRRDTNGNGHG